MYTSTSGSTRNEKTKNCVIVIHKKQSPVHVKKRMEGKKKQCDNQYKDDVSEIRDAQRNNVKSYPEAMDLQIAVWWGARKFVKTNNPSINLTTMT